MMFMPVINLLCKTEEEKVMLFQKELMDNTITKIRTLVDNGTLSFDFDSHTIFAGNDKIVLTQEIVNEFRLAINSYHSYKDNIQPSNVPLSLGGTDNLYLEMKNSLTKTIFFQLWGHLKKSSEENKSHKEAI